MQAPGERYDAAFLKNREPGDCRVCRKDFCENPGKSFWRNCFLEKSGEVNHQWIEIFANGISLDVPEPSVGL
jgi:hypothetical protein